MDELRFVRREERSLIVVNEIGEEYRLEVDDSLLSELRHLSRRDRDTSKVRPREIQALIRAGKTRAEVAKETGLEEADIERYEEPVLAERRYILERAQAVPVRADSLDDEEQLFGPVISERLIGLDAEASEWSSWKDPENGWMISLEFISRDVAHRAIWSFDHRKRLLSPINPDAVNLSKQGDVGDRLIPKLRAVDLDSRSQRFESDAFDGEDAAESITDGDTDAETGAGETAAASTDAEAALASTKSGEADAPAASSDDEYARRREIDQRAIASEDTVNDMSQTADLLDALRRRRGERDRSRAQDTTDGDGSERTESANDTSKEQGGGSPQPVTPVKKQRPKRDEQPAAPAAEQAKPAARSIWGAAGVSSGVKRGAASAGDTASPAADADTELDLPGLDTPEDSDGAKGDSAKSGRKRRSSIPSWDDILFGTRSDEDPASR